MLESMGIGVALSHHEAAPSQHEIDLRYTDALTMADSIMTYRLVVKEVAMRHGAYATFMPKPLRDVNGSGMHLQLSLFRGEENAFSDGDDTLGLSPLARNFMAGLLDHASETMLVTNQWVNSYRRLVPGFEAPTHATWSTTNHADLLRVPSYKPDDPAGTRIEYRVPDPACNPYLAFASLLTAGLDGVDREAALPAALDRDVREIGGEELDQRAIAQLPSSLGEAIASFADSALLRDALGDHVCDSLVANKRHEWDEYRTHVSEFELERYLGVL